MDVRSRMRMLRKKETAEEIIANKEKAKTGMQNLRKSKSKEEKEYDNVYELLKSYWGTTRTLHPQKSPKPCIFCSHPKSDLRIIKPVS